MVNLSAANSDPTHFRLELEVPGNIDPKEIVRKAIDNICDRLDAIDYSMSKIEYDITKVVVNISLSKAADSLSFFIKEIHPNQFTSTLKGRTMRDPRKTV